jgi:hypothetical protein
MIEAIYMGTGLYALVHFVVHRMRCRIIKIMVAYSMVSLLICKRLPHLYERPCNDIKFCQWSFVQIQVKIFKMFPQQATCSCFEKLRSGPYHICCASVRLSLTHCLRLSDFDFLENNLSRIFNTTSNSNSVDLRNCSWKSAHTFRPAPFQP